MLPPADWGTFSLRMILHGRAICVARRPKCSACVLVDYCPSAEPYQGVAPGRVDDLAEAPHAVASDRSTS